MTFLLLACVLCVYSPVDSVIVEDDAILRVSSAVDDNFGDLIDRRQ